MTDSEIEGGDGATNATDSTATADTPIEMEAVETHLQTVDEQLETLLEATEGLEAAGTLRQRLAETRTELVMIRYEFDARCPDSSGDGATHESPPAVTRGGTVHTILGP